MPIDTAEKRRNVSGLAFAPFGPGVTPNASHDVEWRQQAGWGYSGIVPIGSLGAASNPFIYSRLLKPVNPQIVDPGTGRMREEWQLYLGQLTTRLNAAVGNLAFGDVATNASAGFLYVPTCAGPPTGTPVAQSGRAPIVIDSTNHKLYFYSDGSWRDAGP